MQKVAGLHVIVFINIELTSSRGDPSCGNAGMKPADQLELGLGGVFYAPGVKNGEQSNYRWIDGCIFWLSEGGQKTPKNNPA